LFFMSSAYSSQRFLNANPFFFFLTLGIVCKLKSAYAHSTAARNATHEELAPWGARSPRQKLNAAGLDAGQWPQWVSVCSSQEECTHAAMQCYLLELEVILFENNVEDEDENIKLRKNNSLQLKSSCLPCEAHQEANSTVFLQRFQEFLQRLMSNLPYVCCVFLQMHNPHSHFSCI
ncbi:interleukin-15 isoform X1, partial [Arapaima gigas]